MTTNRLLKRGAPTLTGANALSTGLLRLLSQ